MLSQEVSRLEVSDEVKNQIGTPISKLIAKKRGNHLRFSIFVSAKVGEIMVFLYIIIF